MQILRFDVVTLLLVTSREVLRYRHFLVDFLLIFLSLLLLFCNQITVASKFPSSHADRNVTLM